MSILYSPGYPSPNFPPPLPLSSHGLPLARRLPHNYLQPYRGPLVRHDGPREYRCEDSCDCRNKFHVTNPKQLGFKTKDITIRNNARAVRASYLAEAPKFEADLLKYLAGKKEDAVPDRVIDMLVSFINTESYYNPSLLDEVTLNILAFNAGAKSAVEYSLGRLKRGTEDESPKEAVSVVGSIMLTSKLDSGLKSWLRAWLKEDNNLRYRRLSSCHEWRTLGDQRPELYVDTARLMGIIPEADNVGFRSL